MGIESSTFEKDQLNDELPVSKDFNRAVFISLFSDFA